MRLKYCIAALLIFITNLIVAQTNAELADSVKSGFRGLSVVNENVLWMSGRKGLVGNSYNGGKKWKWNRVQGFEKNDFRSIHAFDKRNAVIATAGFPAAILFTTNAGKSWTTSYISKDSAMFFDGISFWNNQHGIIFGDPVNGRMYLSETFDGGKTWNEMPFADRPQLQNGEASFAASGTTIRTLPDGHVYIATGGAVSRLWHSRDFGHHWEVMNTPILQGKPSQGIFSIAFRDTLNGIIVGGDYTNDTLRKDNCFLTSDGGKTWKAPEIPPFGYRSCVEYDGNLVIATGTSGTDRSNDSGESWVMAVGSVGANSVRIVPVKNIFTCVFCGGKYGLPK
ncbi:MAG: oxidoreductase [Bacteroidota bacterium]|nr:oxidoreductase [Bacteroidota bacterium]